MEKKKSLICVTQFIVRHFVHLFWLSIASSRMMNERIDSNGEEEKKKESSHQCDTIIASLDVSMGTRYTRTGVVCFMLPVCVEKGS